MLVRTAEECFRKGVESLTRGKGIEALALFEAAVALERRHGSGLPQARYLSYYGLCVALEAGRLEEGIRCCREAASLEFYNPDLCLHLARVLNRAGRRREAFEALEQGLGLQDRHAGILREMERMGRRRTPVIPFLSRRNPLNVLLGRLTFAGSAGAAERLGAPSPCKRTP